MKSILIIFLMIQAYSLNAGKAFSKHSKKLNTITTSDAQVAKMSDSSQLVTTDNATDRTPPLDPVDVPLEIFEYIMGFLPGNHPFIIQLAYDKNYKLSPFLAEHIVKGFKKTCVKVLRNHEQEKEPSCKYGKAKIDYGATIFQPQEFIDKKRRFLSNLKLFLSNCPEENKALIDSILQKNIQKLYAGAVLSLPVDHLELIYIGMSPKNIKNAHEKAILVAIAKSRDKESKTPTIIYNFKQGGNKYEIGNKQCFDVEIFLLHSLLPSISWDLLDNATMADMPKNSPYRKYPEARGCKDVIFYKNG